jgi:hypothetical protein
MSGWKKNCRPWAPISNGLAMAEPLRLLAQSEDDVPALSALVQDAVVRAGDVVWDAQRRRLVLLLSRYRWEATSPSRVRSALRVESVLQVQRRGWPAADTMLDLLAVTASGDWVSLDWASALDGATAIRIKVEAVDLVLEDLGEPWPSRQQPHHPD